jgi:hypothetical protein
MKNLWSILFVLAFQPFYSTSAAEAIINTEDHPEGKVSLQDYIADKPASPEELRNLQQEEKRNLRFESKFKKLYASHRSKHHGINSIHDPVDKWFWIWTIGWGLGILITIISGASIASGVIGIIWFSFFILGSVALVIWLIKKFGKH